MSMYISQGGLDELKREYQKRVKITRREIADAITSAKEQGDLSENFEYQDAKEQQALNEARIAQLEGMIHDAVIVEQTQGNDTIELGCTFLALVNGAEKTFSLVGSTEADPIAGKISNESPLGRALYGHGPGEMVDVQTPNGSIQYKIISIT
ncbi:transcription elongation factor GreA [Candidatus Uhrbacteria bacterium]|nr:transcription elongation factor GreA [Candidatus Uhrbacteria bacterium]